MKKTLFISLLLVAEICFITNSAFTQDLISKRNELKKEIQDYRITQMKPQFDMWKNEIDRNLNSADLNKLNELRNKAAKLRQEMRNNFRDKQNFCDSNFKNFRKEKKKGFKGKNNPNHSEMIKIQDELKSIIENNQEFFSKLFESAKPKFEQWRNDIKSKMENWRNDNRELIENSNFNKKDFRMKFKDGMGMFGGRNKFMYASILLYNGNIDKPTENSFGLSSLEENSSENIAYPNPFSEYTNIKFNLPNSSDVKITITDEYGKIIETLEYKNLQSGENILPFSPSKNIPNGLYFYKIDGNNYKYSGKLIYQK